jgi:hypothetical protein
MIRCLSQENVDAAHLRNLATNSLNRVSSGDKAGGDDLFHESEHSAEKRRALQPLTRPPYVTTAPRKGHYKEIQADKRVSCGFRNPTNSARRIRFHCTRKQRAATQTYHSLPG